MRPSMGGAGRGRTLRAHGGAVGAIGAVARHLRTGLRRLHRPTAALLLLVLVGSPVTVLAGSPGRAGRLCFLATFFGGVLLVLLSVSGGPGQEYRSGVAVLWVQKRGSLVRFYAARFLGRLLAGWAALLGIAASASLMTLLLAVPDAPPILRTVPGLLAATLTVAGVVHAVSGLGIARDAFAALVVLAGLAMISVGTAVSPVDSSFLGSLLSAVGLPIDQIDFIGRWDFSASEHGALATFLHVAAWAGSWIGLGTLGTWWTERRRFPGEG